MPDIPEEAQHSGPRTLSIHGVLDLGHRRLADRWRRGRGAASSTATAKGCPGGGGAPGAPGAGVGRGGTSGSALAGPAGTSAPRPTATPAKAILAAVADELAQRRPRRVMGNEVSASPPRARVRIPKSDQIRDRLVQCRWDKTLATLPEASEKNRRTPRSSSGRVNDLQATATKPRRHQSGMLSL